MPNFKASIPAPGDDVCLNPMQSGGNVVLGLSDSQGNGLSNLLIFDAVNRKLVLRKVVNADRIPLDLDADGYPVVIKEA